MKYIDEFRNPEVAAALLKEIEKIATEPIHIMEICGGHTHAIFRSGIDQVLPPKVSFIHGPGCPVCVTPMGKINQIINLARRPKTIIATYGDMLRVPGTESTLLKEKANGANVRMVYSSLDALKLAMDHPDHEVVFFAIGFETTIPPNGFSVLKARQSGIKNFSILSNHVLVPPVIKFLLNDPEVKIDAFLGPGHVSTVVGSQDYEFIPRDYGHPVVISGFEPNDILQSVLMILRQRQEGRHEVEVQYKRVVQHQGNEKAQVVIDTIFERIDQEWRGIGVIPGSGMGIRESFREYDAEYKFADWVSNVETSEPETCICGSITKGVKQPWDCPSFGKACTPEHPIGTCMVSSEGTCSAYYRYQYIRKIVGE